MSHSKKTNVIEWINPGPEDIIWVYPDENIRWGSVVIVHEYENAIFMRDGKLYDVLPPGRHVLDTQNLPLLTKAFSFLAGYGETPFKAKVIFVSLKQFRGKFGTSTRVKLGPKTLYLTEAQVYGEYWYRISDPVLFLTQVVGALPQLSTPAVTEFLRGLFVESFTQEFSKYTAIELYSKLSDVTTRIKTGVLYEALKQRGIELIDLKIGGVSLPQFEKMEKEDPTYGVALLAALQRGEEDRVLEIVKTVESMRALGKSPGVGMLGALVALPQMLAPTVAPPQPPQPPSPTTQQQPSSPQPAKSPMEKLRELKQMLDEGLISKEDYEQLKKEILEQYKKS
jgi:membrane protease subunit (stomatin/prohibitin family)